VIAKAAIVNFGGMITPRLLAAPWSYDVLQPELPCSECDHRDGHSESHIFNYIVPKLGFLLVISCTNIAIFLFT
jgi:hypothetical protein